jgi:hypothetical protein
MFAIDVEEWGMVNLNEQLRNEKDQLPGITSRLRHEEEAE